VGDFRFEDTTEPTDASYGAPPDRALDRASSNFMGLASLGLEIGIFCHFLHLNAMLGLDCSTGRALCRPQALGRRASRASSTAASGATTSRARAARLAVGGTVIPTEKGSNGSKTTV
jgi:hypothetical protein